MIHQRLGTINKRVDVGIDNSTGSTYIHASSNKIDFSPEELECLINVLTVIQECGGDPDECVRTLSVWRITLWIPATPPAEVKL